MALWPSGMQCLILPSFLYTFSIVFYLMICSWKPAILSVTSILSSWARDWSFFWMFFHPPVLGFVFPLYGFFLVEG